MHDRDLVKELLSQILKALDTVIYRFAPVKSLADLTDSPSGMEKLDAICMQLIAIGEGLKNLDKITNNSLLHQYPEINWKGAKAMRDIISHHYFRILHSFENLSLFCGPHIAGNFCNIGKFTFQFIESKGVQILSTP